MVEWRKEEVQKHRNKRMGEMNDVHSLHSQFDNSSSSSQMRRNFFYLLINFSLNESMRKETRRNR